MRNLIGLGEYWIAVLLLLSILGIVGHTFEKVLTLPFREHQSLLPVFLKPVVGTGVLTITSVLAARSGWALSTGLVRSSVAIFVVLSLVLVALRSRRRSNSSWGGIDLSHLRKTASSYGIASALGLLPFHFLMRKDFFSAGFGTSATWTNNDLGAYLQMATNATLAGFRDAGQIDGWNAGLAASFDHPGAMTLLASTSSLFDRQPFQVGIVVLASIAATGILAASLAIESLANRQSSMSALTLIVGSIVLLNPVFIGAVANFFLAQVISVVLMIGCFAILNSQLVSQRLISAPLAAVAIASTMLTSIEISIFLAPLVVIFAYVMRPGGTFTRFNVYYLGAVVFATLLLTLVNFGTFHSQFDVVRRSTGSAVAGWTSYLLSPQFMLGLAPTEMGSRLSGLSQDLDVVAWFVIFMLLSIFVKSKSVTPQVVVGFVLSVALVIIAVLKWGADGYQTWKLLTSVGPFMMIALLAGLSSFGSSRSVSMYAHGLFHYVPVFVLGATFGWSAWLWNNATDTSIVSRDLSSISRSEEVRRQRSLNVLLSPFFETMAASSMMGRPVWMMSPSYQFPGGNAAKHSCTLTTQEQLESLGSRGKIVSTRGKYVLVGTPSCD